MVRGSILHLTQINFKLKKNQIAYRNNRKKYFSTTLLKNTLCNIIKGIKNGCPCIVEIRGTQGCALVGDPARANARATILNPFYNMEYKIMKQIRQNTMWIEADILGINLTPNQYKCTRPSHCLRQQWRHNTIQLRDVTIATQRTLLRAQVDGTEIVLKSTDRRSNISLFLYVPGLMHGCLIMFILKAIRWNCFGKMWCISLPRILLNNDLSC